MVKTIPIQLSNEEHLKFSLIKGKKTWEEVFRKGIEQIDMESEEEEKITE